MGQQDFKTELASITKEVEQERARISVVGRSLTLEEQKRLQQLDQAIPLLRSALEILSNGSDPS